MDEKRILVAGVDEVGRGPLAGPVVAAAVILSPDAPIEGLCDSKKISEKKRQVLDVVIREKALAFAIAQATPAEIDELNILQASLLAMRRAVLALSVIPQHVQVDGNKLPELPMSATAHVGGDADIACISAASIIAKVARDALMVEYDQQYPEYGFAKHKGYPTKLHLEMLKKHGVLPFYRRSFSPVRKVLAMQEGVHA